MTAGSARKRVAGARRPGRPSAVPAAPTTSRPTPPVPGSAATDPTEPTEPTEVSDPTPTDAGEPRIDVATATGVDDVSGRPAARRSTRLPAAVGAVLALALLAAALVYALRPTLGDADRAAAVGSARTTLESLLSYSGATFDKHVGEVTPQLAPPFRDQFTKVAATDIKPMAVKNEATVQAKVYDAGVMDAVGDGGDGTTVRVMAFVNQATTTKAQQAPAIDQNRVIATMRKVGDRWLVSDLAAY